MARKETDFIRANNRNKTNTRVDFTAVISMEQKATSGCNNKPELVIFWLLMVTAEREIEFAVARYCSGALGSFTNKRGN